MLLSILIPAATGIFALGGYLLGYHHGQKVSLELEARVVGLENAGRPRKGAVFMAYHSDFSDLVVFGDELDAYIYAEGNFMRVTELPFGSSAREVIR
jgi:hypothetical protein